jgi:hypothetical protein
MSGVGPQRAVERAQAIARAAEHRRRHRGRIVWLEQPLVVGVFKIVGYDPAMVPAEWVRTHVRPESAQEAA